MSISRWSIDGGYVFRFFLCA